MIAVDAATAGNSTVKVPLVTVLSPPKSMAQTAASLECESLKIKQPRAVNEAEVQLVFCKITNRCITIQHRSYTC